MHVRRRTANTSADGPGQDSFLVIVSNVVGILTFLIMVIGMQTRSAYVAAHEAEPEAESPLPFEAATAAAEASGLQADLQRLEAERRRLAAAAQVRQQERQQLETLALAAEQRLAAMKSELDGTQQLGLEDQQRFASARRELEELRRRRQAAENSAAPEVIEHVPTPLAKTVFGVEEHFRLQNGRLVVVPWNEFVERLKAEAPQKVWKLEDAPQVSETLGPIGDFRMRYTIGKVRAPVSTPNGTLVQLRTELVNFVLIPTAEDLGEPLETALAPGSPVANKLDRLRPEQTTITVWTYPDSYPEFRKLRRYLHERGFLVAGRPLPEGFPIGGAPGGSRSNAQ